MAASLIGMYEDQLHRCIRNAEIPLVFVLGTGHETKKQYKVLYKYMVRKMMVLVSELLEETVSKEYIMDKISVLFQDGNESGIQAAKEELRDVILRRCLQHIKANVMKKRKELLNGKKLAPVCRDRVRWTAQLPISGI